MIKFKIEWKIFEESTKKGGFDLSNLNALDSLEYLCTPWEPLQELGSTPCTTPAESITDKIWNTLWLTVKPTKKLQCNVFYFHHFHFLKSLMSIYQNNADFFLKKLHMIMLNFGTNQLYDDLLMPVRIRYLFLLFLYKSI